MIRLNNIKLPIKHDKDDVLKKTVSILGTDRIDIHRIVRRSLDSRKKQDIHYVYSVDIKVSPDVSEESILKRCRKDASLINPVNYSFPYKDVKGKMNYRPVIIGAGPAGYFAALKLAEAGAEPLVIERGSDVEKRKNDIERFWNGGKLLQNSNVSFGEGGAGTFSDGKLNTGNKDKDGIIKDVLMTFHKYGADEAITYDAKPHIGTDVLINVMKNMRERILSLGGEIRFDTLMESISERNSADRPLYDLHLRYASGEESVVTTDAVILAIGHSARDTFKMLYDSGFTMERKPFAVGLRIEHKRETIDRGQYGEDSMNLLPAADYKMTYHAENGRNVFSFCMCPGGYVVDASTEDGGKTVNGMSYSARDAVNSNSAIVVNVMPSDFGPGNELAGIEFQRELERRFYDAGEGSIPVQRYGDFKEGKKTEKLGTVIPNIKGKYRLSELKSCLPTYVGNAIIEGVDFFGSKLAGFSDEDAILSGIESRTSSPVRILRDNEHMSVKKGIFPAGEGAGYAGGITSSAVDGIRCAESLMKYIIGDTNEQ